MNESEEEFWDDLGSKDENKVDNARQVLKHLEEWRSLEAELEVLNDAVSENKKRTSKIQNDILPALLNEMGTEVWKDPESGIEINLATSVNSSLPKDEEKRNGILADLRPIGIDEILGAEYTANFLPSDKRKEAVELLFGLDPQTAILEEDINEPSALSNEQVSAIHDLRKILGWEEASLPVSAKLGVHPSRLKSWLLKKIDAGYGNEVKAAGIWHGKRANKKEPKK